MQSRPKLPDFDTLMCMFRRDPEEYERFRKRLLDEAISEAPSKYQKNMQYVLMRLELAREAAETPLEALNLAVSLMSESLDELNDALSCLQHELCNLQSLLVLERIMHSPITNPPRQHDGNRQSGA